MNFSLPNEVGIYSMVSGGRSPPYKSLPVLCCVGGAQESEGA